MGLLAFTVNSSLASLAQLLPPRSAYRSNPATDSSLRLCAELLLPDCVRLPPDCVRFSCCSPLASASNQLLLPGPIRGLHPLQLLLRLRPLPAAAPRLRPPQLLLRCMLAACVLFSCCSRSRPLRLLLPDCVDCCSPK